MTAVPRLGKPREERLGGRAHVAYHAEGDRRASANLFPADIHLDDRRFRWVELPIGKVRPQHQQEIGCLDRVISDVKPSSPVMPTSHGFEYSTYSFPRSVCTRGAPNLCASATTESCAPAQPAPARIVTFFAPRRSSTIRETCPSLGVIRGRGSEKVTPEGASVAARRETSPGIATTATPCRATAVRIAISRIRGICSDCEMSSA